MPLVAMRAAILAAIIVLLCAPPVAARLNPDLASPAIVINLPSRTLEFFAGTTLVKVYPVAIGKPSTPSPLGDHYYVFEKEVNPWWFPPRTGEVVPSGPHNPLGYRWMGFAQLYGIHGTNAPWAIGLAVSNGCIRMYEEDVEELFEVVPYGTPVRVIYERFRVRIDANGEVSLGIYPDIYGWRAVSVEEVKTRLAAHGLGGLLADGDIARMIGEEADKQVAFARLHQVRVNGKALVERAVTLGEVVYVPVWPVAAALGENVAWDEVGRVVKGPRRSVAGLMRGERLYVTAADAHLLFGGQVVLRPEDNTLAMDVLAVFWNGRPLAGDVQAVDGVLAVPVAVLAGALGHKVARGADGTLTVQGTKVPAVLIGETPYIQITKVYDVFKAYVYWNQEARSIEFTYPFIVKGGND